MDSYIIKNIKLKHEKYKLTINLYNISFYYENIIRKYMK